ncbi:hypothetical protein [Priestia megaterium]|uniref:hypothetical protein n=1 Tax=Priestia megaterium TaxID=1404 RepID=UPI0031FC19F8
MLDAQKKQLIESVLREKGAMTNCGRCGHDEYQLDGYFHHAIQESATVAVVAPNEAITTVGLICKKCGKIDFIAVGAVLPADQL